MKLRPSFMLPFLFVTAVILLSNVPAAKSQDFVGQLDEVRRLIDDRNFMTALEDLKFIAQQIQELRLAGVVHLFPPPPEGWSGKSPVRTSREGEFWSRRLEARRTYRPDNRAGKLDIILDFYSPLIPAVSLSMNPVFIAGDPQSERAEFESGPGIVKFNPDTGEGEAVFIVNNRILVTIVGRGIKSRAVLRNFSASLDHAVLRSFTPP